MEPNEEKQNKWQKLQLVLALVATAALAVMVGTQAWLSYMRRLETAATVDMPTLILQGPKDSDAAPIELGDIDVTQGNSRDYVFSVVSVDADFYQLQLAHTTNIPFTYTIYRTGINQTDDKSVTVGNYSYGYSNEDKLSGSYLNLPQSGTLPRIADTTLHDQTYGDYGIHQDSSLDPNKVHINAEPLYWQSDSVQVDNHDYQRDYYILEISWDASLKNNKETDMVYLTVGLTDNTDNTGTGGTQ